jgi:hypothetical protein
VGFYMPLLYLGVLKNDQPIDPLKIIAPTLPVELIEESNYVLFEEKRKIQAKNYKKLICKSKCKFKILFLVDVFYKQSLLFINNF